MRCEKAAIDENLEFMAREVARGASLAADVIMFPEASITGYVDPVRYPDVAIALDGPAVARFLGITRGHSVTVLGGAIEFNPAGRPFITHVVARNGALVTCYRKRTIVDDESGLFSPGTAPSVFEHKGIVCGVAICADIENEMVFQESWDEGAEVILHAAAPGLYGEQSTRNWSTGYDWWEGLCNYRLGDYARRLGCWIAVATQAGRTIDEDFPGGAYLFNPSGRRVYATTDWAPCSVYLDIDLDTQSVERLIEARHDS